MSCENQDVFGLKKRAVHVHFVVQESFEDPAAYEDWVRDRGYRPSYSRVHVHDPLPRSAEGIDLLVVLGGPQNPSTTTDECPHFDAAAECALISKCVAARKLVIGVCLGAQLVGEALGAKHERSPEKEIGKFPIFLTADGKANDRFADFGEMLGVGHWHSDMPGLTKDAKSSLSARGARFARVSLCAAAGWPEGERLRPDEPKALRLPG